jgi:hypothetical protein
VTDLSRDVIDLSGVDIPALGELGGPCTCGRGDTIGSCWHDDQRMGFRPFRVDTAFHLQRATDWVCVDCLADLALRLTTKESAT